MNRDTGFQAGMEEQPTLRSLGEGADRRYWRRQANRRVRKARFTRNLTRWSLILALQVGFVSLVLYTGHRAWRQISGSNEFSLKRIELVGAKRATSDAIERSVGPYLGGPVLDLNLAEIAQVVKQDPWVLSASLKRVLPDTLRIEVAERTPCAIAIIGGMAHVVDSGGFVIGPTGLQHTDDLPVLTGLPATATPGSEGREDADADRLPEALMRGVASLETLRRTSPVFVDEISELDLSRRDRITLRTVTPGPLLLLDPHDVERNVLSFLALRPILRERVPGAALVDLRWADRVSVMPLPAAES